MRRPVKPFLTEYRGAARRQPAPAGEGLATPPAPGQSVSGRFLTSSQQEDSYDAALRAADALFSGPLAGSKPATSDTGSVSTVAEELSPAPHRTGGRILRVIDEPPLTAIAQLEAERAPKRRGRKPGSKNKPKAPLVAETFPAVVSATGGSVALIAPSVTALQPNSPPTESLARRPAPARSTPETRRGEKYAWIRTKLKPGERWKRRLPKITW